MTPSITVRYALIIPVFVVLSFLAHEFAHFLCGEALGYSMVMNLNTAYPTNITTITHADEINLDIISAAGPLLTIVQGFVFFLILRRKNNFMLFPLLLMPVIMRFMALVISYWNPNDEARISHDLGLTRWTLPAIVCIGLFIPVYKIVRKYHYSKAFVIGSILLVLASCIAVIEANKYLFQ